MVSLGRELITTSKEEAQVSLGATHSARMHNAKFSYVHYATNMHVTTFSTDMCKLVHVPCIYIMSLCCSGQSY